MRARNKLSRIICILIGIVIISTSVFFAKADNDETPGNLDIVLSTNAFKYQNFTHVVNSHYFEELYYSVKNDEGKYLSFNENLQYTGIQDAPYIITIKGSDWQGYNENKSSKVTLTGIPNGNYKIEFTKKDGEYAKFDDEHNGYLDVEPSIANENFSINNSSTSVETSLSLKCKKSYYLYYVDTTGKTPEIQWRIKERSTTNYFGFTYEKDSDGNNVYTYSPDGEIRNITIVSRERTIVKGMPWSSSQDYGVAANLDYGTRLESFYGTMLDKSNREPDTDLYNFVSYTDSLVIPQYRDVGYFYTSTEELRAYTINKKGTDGKSANGKFVLYDIIIPPYDESFPMTEEMYQQYISTIKQKKAILDHYDSYQLGDKIYTNAYVVKGWTESDEEDTIIETNNGEANIIYPLYHHGDSVWTSTSFFLCETASDDEHFLENETFIESFSGETYNTKIIQNGEQINGNGKTFTDDCEHFEYGDLSVEVESNVEDEKQKEVINQNKPSVTKIVLDENGEVDNNCQDTFKFGLFDDSNNLIATVNLKANETKCFDVQISDPEAANYYSRENGKYYIAEYVNADYTLENIAGEGAMNGRKITLEDEVIEDIYKDVYAYDYDETNAVNVTYTDKTVKLPQEEKPEPKDEEEKPVPEPEKKDEEVPPAEEKVVEEKPQEKPAEEIKQVVVDSKADTEIPKTGENTIVFVSIIGLSLASMVLVVKKF